MIHRPMIRTACLAGLGLLAAACASPATQAERDLRNPLERFPLTTAERQDDSLLAVHPGGLSPAQRGAVAALAARWRQAPAATIVLRVPRGGPQEGDAMTMAQQAHAMLLEQGVDPAAIRHESYNSPADSAAPLVATFASLQAVVPECGRSWDNLTGTQSNGNHSNFGCAVTANMAAQIDNPADIVAPRPLDPPDAGRRSVVFDKYRQGLRTGAEIDDQASGVVSQATP